MIQGQTPVGTACVQPTIGAMWALMIQTEPESAPLKSACGAPIAMSGSPSPVMSPTLATLTPTCWCPTSRAGEVDVEEVRIRLLPEIVERDVDALGLAVEHGHAPAAGDVEVGVGGADGEIVEAVAVDVGQRRQRHPGVGVLLEAVVAAADRRGRRDGIGASGP